MLCSKIYHDYVFYTTSLEIVRYIHNKRKLQKILVGRSWIRFRLKVIRNWDNKWRTHVIRISFSEFRLFQTETKTFLVAQDSTDSYLTQYRRSDVESETMTTLCNNGRKRRREEKEKKNKRRESVLLMLRVASIFNG